MKKKLRFNLIPEILGYGVIAFFGVMMIKGLPDLKRYIKISTL